MGLLATIRRDVFSKVAGEVFSRALFLLFFFYAGRKLGTEQFGTLSLAISTTYILSVLFLDPGLNLSTIQLLVADTAHRTITASTVFCTKLLLFIPMVIALWGLKLTFGGKLPAFSILMLAALYALFTALLEYLCSVTNAYHRMDIEAVLKIVNRVTAVILGFVALKFGGLEFVLLALSGAALLAVILSCILLRKYIVSIRAAWSSEILKKALIFGLPIAGTLIVGTIYLKWDLLVLSYFNIGKVQIGYYAGAFKIVEAFSALPTLLGAALFPMMVQLRSENPAALDKLLRASTKAVLLFSLPVTATISLFSRQIISVVYGTQFVPGASVLSILIWCIVPIFLYFYLMFVNIAAGKAKYNLIAGCFALAAGLAANVILVPRIGYIGAAWSALAANSMFALIATWKVCHLFQGAKIPTVLVRLFAAGALMVMAALYAPVSLVLQFAIGLLVYVAVLLVSGALSGDDWNLVTRMFQLHPQPQA